MAIPFSKPVLSPDRVEHVSVCASVSVCVHAGLHVHAHTHEVRERGEDGKSVFLSQTYFPWKEMETEKGILRDKSTVEMLVTYEIISQHTLKGAGSGT